MLTSPVLDRLRHATRESHERLEARLGIMTQIETLEGRRRLVRGFHSLHAGVDAAIAPMLAGMEGLDYAQRRRGDLLDADLAVLKQAPDAPHPIPAPRSRHEALGLMYVLEGSSLGGKVIARQGAARGLDMVGLSFLDPYGAQTGEYWRAFLGVLAREGAQEAQIADIVRGGVEGFAHAEVRLCGAEMTA